MSMTLTWDTGRPPLPGLVSFLHGG